MVEVEVWCRMLDGLGWNISVSSVVLSAWRIESFTDVGTNGSDGGVTSFVFVQRQA